MLGVATTEDLLKPMMDDDHTISVINKKDHLVVSSTQSGIERLKERLDKKGIDNSLIHIAVPAHCPLIDPILGEFREYLLTVDFQEPTIPFISNVTGTWIKSEEATDPNYWIKHIRQTVKFNDGLNTFFNPTRNSKFKAQTLLKKRIFLEVGPGQTLCSFARVFPTLQGEKRLILASVRHPKEAQNDTAFIYKTIGKLWTVGADIQWGNFFGKGHFQRVPLPTYPFEKKKYFVKPKAAPIAQRSDNSAIANKIEASPFSENITTATTLKPTMKNVSRIPNLIEEIKQSLYELSGMEPSGMDAEATFLELGFDSLFLSQAVIKFNYKFKLKLSFRMLFEEASSIAELAAYVDKEIPADRFMPAPVEQPKTEAVIPPPQTIAVFPPTQVAETSANGGGALENLIQQQLSIMQQQLNLSLIHI